MSGLLLGSSYGVAVGLLIYGISNHYISRGAAGPLILLFAVLGVLLSFCGVYLNRTMRDNMPSRKQAPAVPPLPE